MPVNQRSKYVHQGRQPKAKSVAQSYELVLALKEFLEKAGVKCHFAEDVKDADINGAPAIRLGNGLLVLAPDLYCEHAGRRFWVEVKDKCQRFYHPDTGINLQELVSFFDIYRLRGEPILLVFKDASLDECLARDAKESEKKAYSERWLRFRGKPYGGWLDVLLRNSSYPYPLMSLHHSRGIQMYIVYFKVDLMCSIEKELNQLLEHLDEPMDNTRTHLEVYLSEENAKKKVGEEGIRERLRQTLDMYERLRQAGR